MTAVHEVPCSDPASTTLCEEAQISNIGSVAGDGFCRLRVDETAPSGEDRAVFGHPSQLADVAPGAEVTVTLTWPHQKPTNPFTVECQPGPKA